METVCVQWQWQFRTGIKLQTINAFVHPKWGHNYNKDCSNWKVKIIECAGTVRKRAERIALELRKARRDSVAVKSLVRRSSNSPKAVRLRTLLDLVQKNDWDLALPMYKTISVADWYKWSAELHANMIALLEKYEQEDEAQTLCLEATQNMSLPDKVRFYCALIKAYSKCELKDQVLSAYNLLKELPHKSIDVIGYKSLIKALAVMNFPHEAEETLRQMEGAGFKPASDVFKSILYAYGRCGQFQEMERTLKVLESCGYSVDKVTINMMITSYGSHQEYKSIKALLDTMRVENIDFSIRNYNAVANACPTLVSFAILEEDMPLSTRSLLDWMDTKGNVTEELSLVQELLGVGVFQENTDWSSLQWTLELHGMVPSAAYVMLLVWLDEVKLRLEGTIRLPSEISVVCGVGNHSPKRGKSSIKILMSQLMFKMKSPFKLDRLNKGRFIARGKTVKDWLSQVI